MPGFLVQPEDVRGDILVLREQEAHHLARVRRLRPDDRIEVIDGLGHCYQVRVAAVARAEVHCEILGCRDECGENPVQLSLAPALVKGARFDSIVEKATEIGVGCIAPVIADRGVVQPGTGNKIERWRRLIRAAAKQCGRSRLPVLYPPAPLEVVLDCLRRRSDFLADGLSARAGAGAGTAAARVRGRCNAHAPGPVDRAGRRIYQGRAGEGNKARCDGIFMGGAHHEDGYGKLRPRGSGPPRSRAGSGHRKEGLTN